MKIIQIIISLTLVSIIGCASNPSVSSYDINAAAQEAGKYVADGKDEFFMFHIPLNSPVESTSEMLQGHLNKAAKTNANLAITGPDHSLNFEILKVALSNLEGSSLSGANIIYIGDSNQFSELEALAQQAGSAFKSSTFPVE